MIDTDVVRLLEVDARLAPTPAEWGEDLDHIMEFWHDYVTNVSTPGMAVSPGTAAYLYRLCDYIQPRRILDLGSGFSSAVFRMWARDRDAHCVVTTVDDDTEWLDKTRTFLRRNDLPSTGLLSWPTDIDAETFDIVFHDIGGGDLRNDVADLAASAVRPGGAVVFDDAHHIPHLDAYEAAAATHGLDLYPLDRWTLDAIGRFSLLGLKGDTVTTTTTLVDEYERLCATPSDINLHLPRLATIASHSSHIIELGARSGVSTVAFLRGLQESGGWLTSVDISPAPSIGDHANWRFIQGDDTDPSVMSQVHGQCDVLFIDTSHAYEHTLWELRNWSHKVRPGGLIVCHDTELERPFDPPCPATDPDFPVKTAVELFASEHGYRFINFPECWGLGIIEVGSP